MKRDLEIAKTQALVHIDTMTSVFNALAGPASENLSSTRSRTVVWDSSPSLKPRK